GAARLAPQPARRRGRRACGRRRGGRLLRRVQGCVRTRRRLLRRQVRAGARRHAERRGDRGRARRALVCDAARRPERADIRPARLARRARGARRRRVARRLRGAARAGRVEPRLRWNLAVAALATSWGFISVIVVGLTLGPLPLTILRIDLAALAIVALLAAT